MDLTPMQRDLIRHSIGFDGRREKSCAHRHPPTELSGGDDVFTFTRETALAVREPDEHLSREFR